MSHGKTSCIVHDAMQGCQMGGPTLGEVRDAQTCIRTLHLCSHYFSRKSVTIATTPGQCATRLAPRCAGAPRKLLLLGWDSLHFAMLPYNPYNLSNSRTSHGNSRLQRLLATQP